MAVDCIIEDDRWVGLPALAGKASDAALMRVGLEPDAFEISLLGADDARIKVLNADFRAKEAATNVLSWPSAARAAATPGAMPVAPDPEMDAELGDIALAFETCAREAAEQGKTLNDHLTHLIVHGTLHLLGFDHENNADAVVMETLETEILGNLGIADPYKDSPQDG